MYSKILFPTDGSDESAAVLEHAVDLAQQYDATLEGLFVGDQRSYAGMAGDMDREQIREAQAEVGEEALDRVRSAGGSEGIDVATTQSVGVPADEILEVAGEDDVDLIVMGTHGRTGIKRALLGSVAERVVRQSPIPIHLVPVGEPE
jgi:nucleotide-binding universal stress UspA family protein